MPLAFSPKILKLYSIQTPLLEAGTKWFDRFDRLTALRPSKGKLTILRKVEGPVGFPPAESRSITSQGGEAAALPFGQTGGSKPRVRYNLVANAWV